MRRKLFLKIIIDTFLDNLVTDFIKYINFIYYYYEYIRNLNFIIIFSENRFQLPDHNIEKGKKMIKIMNK